MILSREDDERVLEALHAHEVEGLSSAKAGKRAGMSRAAVCGIVKRVRAEADKHPCRCRRKANRDGGMPAKWWAK